MNSVVSNPPKLSKLPVGLTLSTMAASLIIYIVIAGGNKQINMIPTFHYNDFQFDVYCPIDTQQSFKFFKSLYNVDLSKQKPSSNLFIVYIQMKNFTSNIYNPSTNQYDVQTKAGLYYCGLARQWNKQCKTARMVCSIPGPMFYFPVGYEATIIWVNNITTDGHSLVEDGCYDPSSKDIDCTVNAKIINNPIHQACTFNDPTSFKFKTKTVRINKKNIPISPHIHGLQTRPVFDGNPLSWFNSVGDKGVGFISLNQSGYFNNFRNNQVFNKIPTVNQQKNMKIIKVYNRQLPGNLFYHDHAMKSTKYNVGNGLSGLYIIYDKKIQFNLPKGPQEIYIVFSRNNDGDIRHMKLQMKNPNHLDSLYTTKSKFQTYFRNMTYRFRFLNAHFDNTYYNISFVTFFDKISRKQINPYIQHKLDIVKNMIPIPFTVIGTDSSLFHQPVHNVSTFNMGSGQRLQLLIKFDQKFVLPQVNNVYLICYDFNAKQYVIKQKIQLNNQVGSNKYPDPSNTGYISVAFKNLTNINQNRIAANRMQVMINWPRQQRFLINGHYMFHHGTTDRPQIGTTQDWYFINNLFQAHPMHIHLVNFQLIQTYTLKRFQNDCTLYQLDFFRLSKYPIFNNLDNSALCQKLKSLTLEDTDKLYAFLEKNYLFDNFTTGNIGKVFGLNVMQRIGPKDNKNVYLLADGTNCPLNSVSKYICKQTTSSIPTWYKRWKETILVPEYTVSVVRIRWTATTYDQNVQTYPYFHIPQDQLIQFPGYVYHCHILPHEDNEMMRPFMLKPSNQYSRRNPGRLLQNKDMNQIKTKANNIQVDAKPKNYLNNPQNNQQSYNLTINDMVVNNILSPWQKMAYKINKNLNCPI